MPVGIDNVILEDVAKLLVDCGKYFRARQTAANTSLESPLSMVEVESAQQDILMYAHLAAACERYAVSIKPPPVENGGSDAVEREREQSPD